MKRIIPGILLLLILGFLAGRFYTKDRVTSNIERSIHEGEKQYNEKAISKIKEQNQNRSNASVPQKVYTVLNYIKQYNKAPKGYIGGREFKNREKHLEEKASDGRQIRYREWDVNPKTEGRNRGRERLVTGDDERAWYTADHYRTFTEIK